MPAVWLSNYPAVWLSNYPAVWLSNYPAVWLSNYPAVWLSNYPAVWLSNYLAVWLSENSSLVDRAPNIVYDERLRLIFLSDRRFLREGIFSSNLPRVRTHGRTHTSHCCHG